MFNVETYMQDIMDALREKFGNRLLYVGLQGSYLRGEATEKSDIDVVVIIDNLLAKDLAVYKRVISELEMPEKSCGFICGKDEFKKWNPLEMCNFLYGTRDYYGKLSDYIPQYSQEDIINFIKLSVGNLYHEICHRYLHADLVKNKSKLPYSYRNVFFILQSVYFLRTGVFYPTKKELMAHLSKDDKAIMETAIQLRDKGDYDFEEAFDSLFVWCQEKLHSF